jgi:hypothetical protein
MAAGPEGDDRARFSRAIAGIDAANSEDIRTVHDGRTEAPFELVYGRRMSDMLAAYCPDAGEELRLAVRAQHIRRWSLPRGSYPEGKAGYHRWRTALKRLHGEMAAEILGACGYESDRIARVRALIGKEGLAHDAETKVLEDVACLVFIKYYLSDFAPKHEPAKAFDILVKTCRKMTPRARAYARTLALDPGLGDVLGDALARAEV